MLIVVITDLSILDISSSSVTSVGHCVTELKYKYSWICLFTDVRNTCAIVQMLLSLKFPTKVCRNDACVYKLQLPFILDQTLVTGRENDAVFSGRWREALIEDLMTSAWAPVTSRVIGFCAMRQHSAPSVTLTQLFMESWCKLDQQTQLG